MQDSFSLTAKQEEDVRQISGNATHIMGFGGSRSGKTFNRVRAIVIRAFAAPGSRHAILRFRFNHVKSSIILDTFPKVMELCYPGVEYSINKSDWYATLDNKSEIWFGGLDDKERTEKILGQEYATIFLNECSQISWAARNMAVTRLAQSVKIPGLDKSLRLKMLYDCNPPNQNHWTYKVFVKRADPESGQPLSDPSDYASLLMNPSDNLDNLPAGYIKALEGMPRRMRERFLDGKFASVTDNALWTMDGIDRVRELDIDLPDFQRVVVAVDPSGADSEDSDNDAIGICVAALGVDGNAYLLEDLTLKAGPAKWGKVATTAYERHKADRIVGENNYGGAMVKHVIKTSNPRVAYKSVNATRGKVVRAEPIAALCEVGKVRFVGHFHELEDELCSFTTAGYIGERSPNRADAFIWAMTELFPGAVKESSSKPVVVPKRPRRYT